MEELILKLEKFIEREKLQENCSFSQLKIKKMLLERHKKDLSIVNEIKANLKKKKEDLDKLEVKINKTKKESKKKTLEEKYNVLEEDYNKEENKLIPFYEKYAINNALKNTRKKEISIKKEAKKAQDLGTIELIKSIKEEVEKNGGKPLETRDYSKKSEKLFIDLEKDETSKKQGYSNIKDSELKNNEYALDIGRTAKMKIYTTIGKKKNVVLKYRFGKHEINRGMNLDKKEVEEILLTYVPNLNQERLKKIINNPGFDKKVLYMITEPEDIREEDRSDLLRKYVSGLEGKVDERLDIRYDLSLLHDTVLSRANDILRAIIFREKIEKELTIEEKREFIDIAESADRMKVAQIDYFYAPLRKEESALYSPRIIEEDETKNDKTPNDILADSLADTIIKRDKYLKTKSEKDKKEYEVSKQLTKNAKKRVDEIEKD